MGKIDYKKIYDERRDGWKEPTSPGNKTFETLFAGQYSENSHFIYELLQNAEDAEATFITFVYQRNRLIVCHDGRPFTEEDVRAICSVMDGTKDENDSNTVGHFGMGFKSVFKYTDRPEVYSDDNAFAIENYLLPVEISLGSFPMDCQYQKGTQTTCPFSGKEHCTRFVLPFKADLEKSGIDPKDTVVKLQGLEPEILLFLRHIQTLTWIDETTGNYGEYWKSPIEADEEAPHSGEGTAYICKKSSMIDGKTQIDRVRYLVYEDQFSLQEMDRACVKLAFQLSQKAVVPVDSAKIWVFFPTTDVSGLKFLIHGTYRTPISREKIISDSTFNQELFRKTEDFFVKILPNLCSRKLLTQSFLQNILLPAFQSQYFRGLKEKAKTAFLEGELLPTYNGDGYCRACDARLAVPYTLPEIVKSTSIGDGADFVALKDVNHAGRYYSWLRDDLNLKQWTLCDFADLISEHSLDEFGGNEEVLLFLSAVKGEGQRWGNPDYYDDLDSCYKSARKKLAQMAIVPNQAGGFSPPRKENSNGNNYLYFKKEGAPNNLPDERYVSLDLIEENRRKDICDFLRSYFGIKDYELEDYVRTVIVPKYQETPSSITDDEHIDDMRRFLNCRPGCDTYVRIKGIPVGESPYSRPSDLWFETDADGNSIEDYLKDLKDLPYPKPQFVDLDFYESYSIYQDELRKLGIKESLVENKDTWKRKCGDTKDRYRRCEGYRDNVKWSCDGPFRYELSFKYLEKALEYIKRHPQSELAREKSKVIWNLLMRHEDAIHGEIIFKNSVREVADCYAVYVLMEKGYSWVYDENGNLVNTRGFSQHNLDPNLYKGLPLSPDSNLYHCLEFKKDIRDFQIERQRTLGKMQEKVSTFSDDQLRLSLRSIVSVLKQRGISCEEIISPRDGWKQADLDTQHDEEDSKFPWEPVRNLDRLKLHVEKGFACTSLVRYEKVMRRIRVTQNSSKSYLKDQYEREGHFWCQLCHQKCDDFESVEFEETPQRELDQMHLSLCPNCAAKFRRIRGAGFMEKLKEHIRGWNESATSEGPIKIPLDDAGTALWFSPVHLAEVKTLLELLDEEAEES